MAALPSHWKQNETPASWVTRSDPKILVPTDLVDQGNLPSILYPCTAHPASPRVGWMPPPSLSFAFFLRAEFNSALYKYSPRMCQHDVFAKNT